MWAKETVGGRTLTEGQSNIRTVRRVLPYLWPKGERAAKIRVVAALVALLVAKIATVSTPFFFKYAVDTLSPQAEAAIGPAYMLALGAVGLVLAYGVMRLAGVAFQALRDVIFSRVGQRALRKLALETFRHVHTLSLRYHIQRKTGALNRVLERGVKGVDFLLRFLLFSIVPLFAELLMVAAILWAVFSFSYLAVVAVTVTAYVWFTFAITEWRVKIRKVMNDRDQEANQKAVDSLLNFETVKYFGAERREAVRYDASMMGYERAALQTEWSLGVLNVGQSFFITAGLVTIMVMAAIGVQNGTLTVGDFVMVNAYMIQLTVPLNFLGYVYREIRQSLVDMREMFDLLDQNAEVTDPPAAPALKVSGGAVLFEDVAFDYDPERPILKHLALEVPAGQTVAIVGPSGSGKSTIARLLFRFYDVGSGCIRIDGQDIRSVTQESLRRVIGVVPQDTVLFNDTVYYNIAYGNPDADEAAVKAAAKAARIHEFIAGLPRGYDTEVGERGLKLSGGEKQRVGIARTILKDPPILILDEATSALDTETERGIQESLREMSAGRTVITIAHRLSTVVDADRIVVLEAGEVVETGKHADLLARDGRYARMWSRQQAEKEEAPA